MNQLTIIAVLLVAAASVLAEGEYYVPRAYYTIDRSGHASPPVLLASLRARRSPSYGWGPGGALGVSAQAQAQSHDSGGYGGFSSHARQISEHGNLRKKRSTKRQLKRLRQDQNL